LQEEALDALCGELPLDEAVNLSIKHTAEGMTPDGYCWFVDQCSLLTAFIMQGFACYVFLLTSTLVLNL